MEKKSGEYVDIHQKWGFSATLIRMWVIVESYLTATIHN